MSLINCSVQSTPGQHHRTTAPEQSCRLLQGGYASAPVSNPLYDGPDEASHALEARVRAVEEVLQRGGSGGQLVLPHSGSLDLSMPGRVPEVASSVGGPLRCAVLQCHDAGCLMLRVLRVPSA